MNEKLRSFINDIFLDAPEGMSTTELKEEILQNLIDKYNDLVAQGKSQEAAFNIAVASVGDISDLVNDLSRKTSDPKAEQELANKRRRSALITAVAVGMYITCVLPVLLLQELAGIICMFLMIATATGLLIYDNMSKTPRHNLDGTMVEEFREWKTYTSQKRSLYYSIRGAVWSVSVALYILISFWTMDWHITWIIFPLAASLNAVIRAFMDWQESAR